MNLPLHREVPLVRYGRPDVGIPDAQRDAGELVAGVARRRQEALVAASSRAGWLYCAVVYWSSCSTRERRIDGQAQVGARAFQVIRERVAGADHQFAAAGCPGDAEARLEIGDAVVLVVERIALLGHVLPGDVLLAGDQVEVRLAVVDFNPGVCSSQRKPDSGSDSGVTRQSSWKNAARELARWPQVPPLTPP